MADEMGLGKTVGGPLSAVPLIPLTVPVAMHCPDVDLVETIARSWKINHSKMCYRLSLQSSSELGK